MADYKVIDAEQLDADLTTVADAIREKGGTSEPLAFPNGMADAVRAIESGSGDSYYDMFWDAYQQNGNRDNYDKAFGSGSNDPKSVYWTKETFKPKYDMVITVGGANNMFQHGLFLEDFVSLLDEQGIRLDISQAGKNGGTNTYMFMGCKYMTTCPPLDLTNLRLRLNGTFNGCLSLKKLELVNVQSTMDSQNGFNNMSALEELVIDGVIGRNGFNFQWSTLLSHDSLVNLLNILEDKTEDTSDTKWLITIGEDNIAKLTDEELDIAYMKGWTVV